MSAHIEGKMLFSSLLVSELCSQMPQGTEPTKVRRRRKKTRAEGGSKKRRLSDEQVQFLEMSFGKERKLESGRKVHLAAEIGLDPKQVAVWFQNRRARHKSKQVEDAYLKLKSLHDAAVLEKCHLENEVLKLKDQLREAEEELKKLSIGCAGGSAAINGFEAASALNIIGAATGSPVSSISTDVTHQPPPMSGEFGMVEVDADHRQLMSYVQEYNYGNYYMMEWPNIYDM